MGGIGTYIWAGEELAADVAAWLEEPGTNYGWAVLGNEATRRTAKRFDTHEHATASFRPVLTIEFTPGGAGCAADWDGSGVFSSDDVFAFLEDYFAGRADFNADGVVTSDDYFAFLAAYFEGC